MHGIETGAEISKGFGGAFLEVERFLVKLHQVIRRTFEQSLSVRVELDGGLGTEVSTDNLRHVGIILFKARISSVPGDSADCSRVDFDVGIGELHKRFSCNFWEERLFNRSRDTGKSAVVGEEVLTSLISHCTFHEPSLRDRPQMKLLWVGILGCVKSFSNKNKIIVFQQKENSLFTFVG